MKDNIYKHPNLPEVIRCLTKPITLDELIAKRHESEHQSKDVDAEEEGNK